MSSRPTAAERAVSLCASAGPVCPEEGRKGGAASAHSGDEGNPGKGLCQNHPFALLPAGPVLTGLGSGNCGFQGRDDVLNKTQEKDSEPQSFEGTSCSLTFLQEILSWGVSSTLAYCA